MTACSSCSRMHARKYGSPKATRAHKTASVLEASSEKNQTPGTPLKWTYVRTLSSCDWLTTGSGGRRTGRIPHIVNGETLTQARARTGRSHDDADDSTGTVDTDDAHGFDPFPLLQALSEHGARVAVMGQVSTLLRQRGRLTYRTLQRQFPVDRLPRRIERLGYDGHLEPMAVPVV